MNKTDSPDQNIQQELDKFSKMASQWWDLNGPCAPLHAINPIRLNFVLKHSNIQNKKVIDVGCGGGILSESLAKAGGEVTAIDLNKDLIEIAKLHLLESKLKVNYIKTPIEAFSSKHSESFDTVTCMELIEHVPDPEALVKNCAELVKPDGLVFFSTLNRNIKAYLKAIIGAEYLLNMLPPGTHQYEKFVKPSELSKAARDCHLELIALGGFNYNPLSKKYFACDDISVNYMACFKKL